MRFVRGNGTGSNVLYLIANDCGDKILHFWANPHKYQTLVPTKNSHLKVAAWKDYTKTNIVQMVITEVVDSDLGFSQYQVLRGELRELSNVIQTVFECHNSVHVP